MSRQAKFGAIFSAQDANGNGTAINVQGYRHIVVRISTASSADGLLKCLGSSQPAEPTWGSAAAVGNVYAPKRMINQDSNASVTGSDGLNPGGTDIVREYKVNTDGLRWINFNLSSYAAGEFTVEVSAHGDSRVKQP